MASTNNTLRNEIKMESPEDVKQRFNRLLNYHPDLVDVHFIIGNNDNAERIPAHKFMLSVKSDVFKTMFYGSLPMQVDEIELPDVELEGFLRLLHYFYFDRVLLFTSVQVACDTLYVANKYIVHGLEFHCIEFLKMSLTCENAIDLLTKARLYNNSKLEAACFDVIDTNTIKVFEDSHDVIEDSQVFKFQLFNALVKWSKSECVRKQLEVTSENQQNVLGEAIDLIRFDLMTLKDLISGPFQSGLLPNEKVQQISMALISKENCYIRCVQNSFRSHPSCNEKYLKFDINDLECPIYCGFVFKHTFIVTKYKLCIVGFTVSKSETYDIHLDLFINNNLCINDNMFQQTYASDQSSVTVKFHSPILLTLYDVFHVNIHFSIPVGLVNLGSLIHLKTKSLSNGNTKINMDDYLKWGAEQSKANLISEIRFFE